MQQLTQAFTGWIVGFAALFLMAGFAQAGNLEPSGFPGPTMKTLDQIPPTWSQKLAGSKRFELVLGNNAALDRETGLVWQQSVFSTQFLNWDGAIGRCRVIAIGGRFGWRVPAIEELATLLDPSVATIPHLPIFPSATPFH